MVYLRTVKRGKKIHKAHRWLRKGFQLVSLSPETTFVFCFKVPEMPLKALAAGAVGAENRWQEADKLMVLGLTFVLGV